MRNSKTEGWSGSTIDWLNGAPVRRAYGSERVSPYQIRRDTGILACAPSGLLACCITGWANRQECLFGAQTWLPARRAIQLGEKSVFRFSGLTESCPTGLCSRRFLVGRRSAEPDLFENWSLRFPWDLG